MWKTDIGLLEYYGASAYIFFFDSRQKAFQSSIKLISLKGVEKFKILLDV